MGAKDRDPIPRNERGGTEYLDKLLEFQRNVVKTAMELLEKDNDVSGAEIARVMNSRKEPDAKTITARQVTNILARKKWRKYKARYAHAMSQPARAKRMIMACQISALIHVKGIEVLRDILFR